jgi:predicted ATP-binding protein involved in virulence
MSELNLFGENLSSLKGIDIPLGTTQLILDNNFFTEIPSEIGLLTNLNVLFLPNNKITKLDFNILSKFKKLEILILNNNLLKQIPDSILELQSIQQLRFDSNQLTHLPENIGELQNLTLLDLRRNQLTRLPESIKKLTKLTDLYLANNPGLPLPPNYKNGRNAASTIEYILKHQAPLSSPIEIKTNDIYIFRNISTKEVFQKEYGSNVNKALEEYKLNIHEVTSVKDLTKETTLLFIIAPYDTHENQDLIFNIISECEKENIRYSILIPEQEAVHVGLINMDFAAPIDKRLKKIQQKFKSNCHNFKSTADLSNLVLTGLKHFSPKIVLNQLVLNNIGHFENTSISFDDDLTCLVGENGTGKTTLLRALALGIIGSKNKDISLTKVENLLRIESWHGSMNFAEEGFIELHYTINNRPKTQKITFTNEGQINIVDGDDFELLINKLETKTLILGFPQIRSLKEGESRKKPLHANVTDIIPLINNQDDERLESFSSWLVNLFGKGQTKINSEDSLEADEEVEELILINKVFGIISKLTKHEIAFKSVANFAPPQIIVSTFDSPNGIPLDLLSQGFKVLIGWIGHFLQRLAQSNPINRYDFEQENAIVIVDEIDSYIHPIWQQGFLHTLREIFPNTQFIISTHSPLLVAGLDRNQIVELEYNEETKSIDALENQADTWAMSYTDILLKLFNTRDPKPTKTIEDLERQLGQLDLSEDEKNALLDNIERLKDSAAYKDSLEFRRQQLEEREIEIEALMQQLKTKLNELK